MFEIAGTRPTRKAKEEITSDGYDDIVSKGAGNEDYEALQEAESLLFVYFALPRMNLRVTEKGGLQRRTGVVDNENDLMSYSEMNEYRSDAFGDAMDILEDIAPDRATSTDPVFAL